MKRVILLTLSLSLSSPCFGMGRASQPAVTRWTSRFVEAVREAYSPFYIRPQSSREILNEKLWLSSAKLSPQNRQFEVMRAEDKLGKELVKQSRLYSNATNRYNRKSLYEWWSGESSRFDVNRRERAFQDGKKAIDNFNAAARKYNDIQRFILKEYGRVVTPPLNTIYRY
jgi:hypothetical protein